MDLSLPLADFMGANAAKLVRRLALVSEGLTTRRLAALAEVPLASAARTLADLVEVGIVSRQRVGNAHLHTLNRAHVLWPAIESVLEAPERIEQIIREVLQDAPGEHMTAASFGSFARRSGSRASDIDLVIVWDDDATLEQRESATARLRERVSEATGNEVDVVDLDQSDLARLTEARDPLATSWSREARTIVGIDLKSRLRAPTR